MIGPTNITYIFYIESTPSFIILFDDDETS